MKKIINTRTNLPINNQRIKKLKGFVQHEGKPQAFLGPLDQYAALRSIVTVEPARNVEEAR